MSQDFTNQVVDAALAEKLRAARTPEEIRALCLEDGVMRGVFQVDPSGSTSVREDVVVPRPAPQPVPQDDGLFRRAVKLDNGVVRLIEAYSVSGLDILENGIRKSQGRGW